MQVKSPSETNLRDVKLLQFLNNCNLDYEKGLSEIKNTKEKGDIFEYLCYYILKYHPYYINKFSEIYLYADIPQQIRDQFKLPETDQGIDIIAICENNVYAVQCKFRANKNSVIPWADIATFYGLKDICQIAKSIFMTNCYDVCKLLENKISENFIVCCGDFWQTITPSFLSDIRFILNHNKLPPTRELIPKPHQQECLNAFNKFIVDNKSKRGKIIMPCGSGKTLQSYFITRAHNFANIIIAVPSLHLLSQYYLEFSRANNLYENKCNYLLIGSDIADEIKSTHGLIFTTNYEKIKTWITKYENRVIFTTYQSSDLLKKAFVELGENCKFDVCFYDEAHKTIGDENKQFSLLLGDEFKTRYKIFLTATPKFYVGEIDNMKKFSMSNIETYGENIFSMNMRDAINVKLLCNYQLITPICNEAMLYAYLEQNKIVYDENLKTAQNGSINLASAVMLLKSIQKHNCVRKILTYHNTIKEAQDFKKLLIELAEKFQIGEIYVEFIEGKNSMAKRMRIFDAFKNSKIGIICSAKTLNEGINLPYIDSVCFVSARKSVIDIVQCVGRCMRLYEGKLISNIIIPLFGEDNAYYQLYNVINALKTQDSNIVEYFREKRNKGVSNKLQWNSENIIEIDIPEKINVENWHNSIDIKIGERVDGWNFMYEKVKKYCEENRKLPGQKDKDKKIQVFGKWISHQRDYYKNNKLSSDKINKMNELQFWFWDGDDELNKKWNEIYEKVKKYTIENNKMPTSHDSNKDIKALGNWTTKQRENYKNNKLSKEKIKQLEIIHGWYWSRFVELENCWYEIYEKIKLYITEYKHIPSAKDKNKEIKSFGNWVCGQRMNYKNNKLSQDKIDKLIELKIIDKKEEIVDKNNE